MASDPGRIGTRARWEAAALLLGVTFGIGVVSALLDAGARPGKPMFGDYIAFYSAGRIALDGAATAAYDSEVVNHAQQLAVPGVTTFTRWRSPPTFLLLMAPLAALPYHASAIAFHLGSCAVYFAGAARLLPDRRALWFALWMPWVVLSAIFQTGPLMAGLAALALAWLDARPIAAGVAIGLFALKPHLALVWPVMLLAGGRWSTLAAAAATASALALGATIAFGPDVWPAFLDKVDEGLGAVGRGWPSNVGVASLYPALRGLGLPHPVAAVAQVASGGAATALAGWIWGRDDRGARGAAVCAATLLVSPYLFYYDASLLGVAAAALVCDGRANGAERVVSAIGWGGVALCGLVGLASPVPAAPIVAWSFLAVAARRAWTAPASSPTR